VSPRALHTLRLFPFFLETRAVAATKLSCCRSQSARFILYLFYFGLCSLSPPCRSGTYSIFFPPLARPSLRVYDFPPRRCCSLPLVRLGRVGCYITHFVLFPFRYYFGLPVPPLGMDLPPSLFLCLDTPNFGQSRGCLAPFCFTSFRSRLVLPFQLAERV